jgi:ATP-dependent DNA helicase RecG
LLSLVEKKPLEVYKAMDLVGGPEELLYPKNIALMMFNHRPEKFFPYSRIEIVEFPYGMDDPTFFEKPAITGPVYSQIQQALLQLQSVVLKERIYKNIDRPESDRIWNYPYRALEESIANALYHRTWEVREPVEIRILPDRIEIINQGGPDRSVKLDEIQKGNIRNKRYRNRRIGDFLKELDMTEGRGTGIPIIRREMKKNGSPEPRFETDDYYSYFITTLPIHPAYLESSETLNETLNEGVKISENQFDKIFDLIHEGVNDGVFETLKIDLKNIIELIYEHAGITQSNIIYHIGKSRTTAYRYLNILIDSQLIEYKGARKTGGYYLTDKAKDKLK